MSVKPKFADADGLPLLVATSPVGEKMGREGTSAPTGDASGASAGETQGAHLTPFDRHFLKACGYPAKDTHPQKWQIDALVYLGHSTERIWSYDDAARAIHNAVADAGDAELNAVAAERDRLRVENHEHSLIIGDLRMLFLRACKAVSPSARDTIHAQGWDYLGRKNLRPSPMREEETK